MGNRTAGMRAPRGAMRSMLAVSLAIAAPLGLAACVNSSYAGIPFATDAADPELQSLARLARSGDKHAQLKLGIRYEEGRGVPVDLERARDLYFDAATNEAAERISIFLPRPDTSGGGIQHILPGRLEFSGHQEAAVRWNNVSRRLSDRRNRSDETAYFIEDPPE